VFFDPEYYRVVKNIKNSKNKKENAKENRIIEKDQNFLMINPEKATYKIQILNVDLQKEQIVDIKIADKSGVPNVSKAADISKNNINFEFGIE